MFTYKETFFLQKSKLKPEDQQIDGKNQQKTNSKIKLHFLVNEAYEDV